MKTTKIIQIAREEGLVVHEYESHIFIYRKSNVRISLTIPNVAEISAFLWEKIRAFFGI